MANPWQVLAPGLEKRTLAAPTSALAQFIALRIDPALFSFRVHYSPGQPLFVNGWAGLLPDATVIVNTNYFTPDYTALGLVVTDGIVHGQSYVGMGGLLQSLGDTVRVRSTIAEPYAGETLDQAVQGFPVLVANGVTAFTRTAPDRPSRRTVIGQDAAGRILVLVSSSLIGMTLHDLAAWLPATDLGLMTAINFDGGGSTLLGVRAGAPTTIPSFDAVPTVLAIYPR